MILVFPTFLIETFCEFLVSSLHSTLVLAFLHLVYQNYQLIKEEVERSKERQTEAGGEGGMGEDVGRFAVDLAGLPDSYTFTDKGKTSRIACLEREIEVLTKQLVESRNQVNRLGTELERYRTVHSQVSYVIEQFRNTVNEAAVEHEFEKAPPTPPPLPPRSLLPTPTHGKRPADDVTSDSSKDAISDCDDLFVEGDTEEGDDWATTDSSVGSFETTEEKGGAVEKEREEPTDRPAATDARPSCWYDGPDDGFDSFLANATLTTHISEIFRIRCADLGQPLTVDLTEDTDDEPFDVE